MEYYKNLDLADIKYFCEFDLIWKVEQWKDVVGYEGLYMVSDLGRVKSFKRKKVKILTSCKSKRFYLIVVLSENNIKKTKYVHKLVSMAFLGHIPCGYELVINHKNLNKTDNRVCNLEAITHRENTNQKHLKSSSKYIGVHLVKPLNKWRAKIKINGKTKNLGLFTDEIIASNAYQNALKELTIKNNYL